MIVSFDAIMKAANPPQNLFEFFQSSPLAGLELDVDRITGDFRQVDL